MFWWQRRSWFVDHLEQNIAALNNGDHSRIPWIFCVFSEKHNPSKLAAARALDEILGTFSFNDIVRIDEQMRQTTSMEWSIDWGALDINSFLTPRMSISERRAVIIFASFNPNGYIREKAVQMMKDYDGTLPYILLRQNDWVPQVREAASAAFTHRLQHLSDGEILDALPYADKLIRSTRGSHSEFTNRFFAVLAAKEYDLMMGLKSTEIRTRRICIDVLFAVPCLNTMLAFERLACEPDPFLRAVIFRNLKSRGVKMDEVICQFLNDKYPMNRMLAFQYLRDTRAGNLYEITGKLLLDKNAEVREFAQNAMREQAPEFDYHDFYLNHLHSSPVAAIYGLSEKGLPSDTEEIAAYLHDSRIGVVKSAMTSLMRLNREEYGPTITDMLDDARAGIVKTARNLILKNGQPNYDRVKEIFHTTSFVHTRFKCMDILFTASKWSRLIHILETMFNSEEAIKKKALVSLSHWLFYFNRSYALPNEAQMAEIRKLIDLLSGTIPPDTEKVLLFTLSSTRFRT
ncbi:MAG: hypothetical protein FWC50_12180 [Planctomycetaceae bacterium]|nr:hypothetical protein [Planctomycetaceae bacterium]